MDDHSLLAIGVPDIGQRNGFAIPKIVCINELARPSEEFVMPGLFDVSKETILITGASQGLGRHSRGFFPRMAPRSCWRRGRPLN
jgi:hypothetical protein